MAATPEGGASREAPGDASGCRDETVERDRGSDASRVVDLVGRATQGHGGAFEQLAQLFGSRLYRFLVVRLGNQWEAEDALQETLLAAWQQLPTLRRQESFWPWLVGIAVRKAADQGRRRLPGVGHPSDEAGSPSADAEWVEIRTAIESLPPRHREVLLVRYVLGLSEQEAARALGVRVGTIKSRTSRARRDLGEALSLSIRRRSRRR
jgi:RNA polymerase sigma-70 factor (ECF subfamily)